MATKSKKGLKAAAVAIAVAIGLPLAAQQSPQIDFKSVGRGAPVMVDSTPLPQVGAIYQGGAGPGGNGQPQTPRTFVGSAPPGETPKGIEPLPRDMFTSDDFYKDKDLWSDGATGAATRRVAIEDTVDRPRRDRRERARRRCGWGNCDADYPREAIVSPYAFKTAQEHYEALKAETTKRGGPTKHTYATVPGEWTGRYGRGFGDSWYGARKMQVPTMMSLLTPKYQDVPRAGDLPPGQHERRALAVAVLLARGVHAALARGRRSRSLHHGDAAAGPDS